jgi:hypothetical protein
VSNLSEGAKRAVESVQVSLEPDLLYPLLRSGDVGRWHSDPKALILVTHERGKGLKAIPEHQMAVRLPKTYAYLKHFEVELASRSGYRRYFKSSDPFYSVFNVGDYTFAPFKVVWPNIGSEITAAVVSEYQSKLVIPQHIVTLVACEQQREAHYICSVLNTSAFNFAVQSYSQKGGKSFGTPQVLENVRVPQFDPTNTVHLRLADLSQQAHAATAAGDTARVQTIEAEIDRLAAQLWGLTDAELREIQESLAELG